MLQTRLEIARGVRSRSSNRAEQSLHTAKGELDVNLSEADAAIAKLMSRLNEESRTADA